ncbi:MAG: glycosyltransferase [Victivallales bacterium]|jgi:glycosyltransferase XagB|nr:glycosyltransferase [Victivallales bacterium]MBT7161786.1 glycosyltransferase [Victivallales bacterium]MBT7304422.1 glycosyltransferase [Victivallales bacterium]
MSTFNATEYTCDDPYGPRGFPQATIVLVRWQRIAMWSLLAGVVIWGVLDWRQELLVINAVFTLFFLASTLYRVMLIDASLRRTREIKLKPEDLVEPPNGKEWPRYVVILPMYHEGDVVAKLVAGLRKLDYPIDRLEIRLLIEEDDMETMTAAKALNLEPPFVITPIPVSHPRTKPKACNVAIQEGDFDYLVIYDAEDQPEPDQLKKAAVAFHRCPDNVASIQGKLCFYNSGKNLLTRLFTAEYSTWFGLCLPGLDAYEAPIPLGGTSNHFRWDVLREVGGWDEFNVTEDCDLGLRLFVRGWRTRVLDSTTWEQACPTIRFWVPQRSRWVKGYMQTYLVHTRDLWGLTKQLGFRNSLHFHLLIGGSVFSQLICPFYWLLVLMWLVFRPIGLSQFFPGPIFAMGALCLFVGNFFFAYTSGIACIRRGMGHLAKYALLMPFYWIMLSAGAWKGFLQLITKPHHWEKTKHFAE